MPEIVEVQIQTEGLREQILNDVISDIKFMDKGEKIILPVNPIDFINQVRGKRIQDVFRIGKYIVFKLDDTLYLATHLRMTGRYLIDVPEEEIGHTRIIFEMGSEKTLRYSDVRVFGKMTLVKDLKFLKKGLDVWDSSPEEITNHILSVQKKFKNKNLKEFFTHQGILCGLGNVYANELLFRLKLHPGKLVQDLNSEEIIQISKEIKDILQWSYELGGLSMKDYYHVDGSKGRTQEYLSVYRKESCSNCGTKIERTEEFDGRSTFFCPNCQR